MRIMPYIMIFILSLSLVSALDLSDYPNMFVKEVQGKKYFDGLMVLGDFATASDVIGAIDLAVALQSEVTTAGLDESLKGLYNSHAVLASEIKGIENRQSLIIIGGPCANPVAAHFLNTKKDCTEGFLVGKARIKIFENGKYVAILVAGLHGEETRMATSVLSNYKDYKEYLKGEEVVIGAATILNVQVSN